MITIKHDNSNNKDFRELIIQLDADLNTRNGIEQSQYDTYNKIDFIDTVVLAYYNDQPVGCGCFKAYNQSTIEIKRMFVRSEMRGKGISKLILHELENWGKKLGYKESILETGSNQHEAIGLYFKQGYSRIPNYDQYADMPNSVCMKKSLA